MHYRSLPTILGNQRKKLLGGLDTSEKLEKDRGTSLIIPCMGGKILIQQQQHCNQVDFEYNIINIQISI